MGTYGETVHCDDLDGYRLLLERDRWGSYVLDLVPEDAEDTGDDGVHVYLTREQLISMGAAIQAEVECQGLS